MPFVRIQLDQINIDDPAPLVIQAFLKKDMMPLAKFPYAGWWGTPNHTDWCWPLIFKPDGHVVYGGEGADEDDPEALADERKQRLSHMNIFDRPFEKGARYVMKHFDGNSPSEFIVRNITEVTE